MRDHSKRAQFSQRWHVLLAIGTSLAVACATGQGTRDAPGGDPSEWETWGTVDEADLEFPERIGTFSLVEVTDFTPAELGVQLRYVDSERSGATIDVFVYPISKPNAACLRHVLQSEAWSIVREMDEVVRRAGGMTDAPSFFRMGPSSEEVPLGIGWQRNVSVDAKELVSFAFVAVRDHRFFKIRMTLPRQDLLAERDGYLREVLDVLYPAIRLRSPIEDPDLSVTIFANVFLPPQHESCNVAGWMLVAVEMVEQIRRGNYLDTFEREFSARKRMLEHWLETRADGEVCPSDVLEAMARSQEAGFLEEYVFTTYGGGRWPQREDLDLASWASWSEVHLESHDPVIDPGFAIGWKRGADGSAESRTEDGAPAP